MRAADAHDREPLAVVGIGCRLPGGADGPGALWRLLGEEFDAIGPVPADRFDVDALYTERPASPGRIATRWGGFLPGIDRLDAAFFGIAPREAERLDPQQRLLLETAWEALEDAGLPRERIAGTTAGVFVGMWLDDYEARVFADPAGIDLYATTGTGRYSASGRLSFFLDLRGPSITVDTACSSSLVAVHLAGQSLRTGECDVALAGGANVILEPNITIAYSQSGMMAPDGQCKFGDADGDGYVRSDGAAVVVLKRLSSALAGGDRIHAVIRGTAVTNDGRSSGFLATPGQAGQEQMLRRAYADAGVDPRSVGYVEAHGTGTAAGDPVELRALGAVVGASRAAGEACLVGSLKSNIGHTEGAAGIAGLIKAALAVEHGEIPASIHVATPNPVIAWTELGLELCTTRRPWPAAASPRRAGVSSFGIAGTNAHVVLEAAPATASPEPRAATPPFALALSADSAGALQALAADYRSLLEADPPSAGALCASAARGRSRLRHRVAVIGDVRQLIDGLEQLSADTPTPEPATAARVAFVFPGQGGQWLGMGRDLLAGSPAFRDAMEGCDTAIRAEAGWSPIEELEAGEATSRLNDIGVVQPLLFAVQVALAAQWRAWGVEPAAVVGHSMGEVAAAHIAGALTLADATAVICRRSALLRRIAGQGAMAVVDLPPAAAARALEGVEDRLAVAVVNGPRSVVVSGEPDALDTVLASLEAQDVFCRRVQVDVASHSPQVDPLLDALRTDLVDLRPGPTAVTMVSTVEGGMVAGDRLGAGYWARNLRQPVRFGDAVEKLAADGCTLFVELGPHPVLLAAIDDVVRAGGGRTVASMRRGEPDRTAMLHGLAALYSAGVDVDWRAVTGPPARPIDLPAYPWQRERFWYEPTRRAAPGEGGDPVLGRAVRPLADPGVVHWETDLGSAAWAALEDHTVRGTAVMPAAGFAELAWTAATEARGSEPFRLVGLELTEVLPIEAGASVQVTIENGRVAISSMTAGEPRLHAAARIESIPPPTPLMISVDDLHVGLAVMSAGDHYAAMQERGLDYGPAFRVVADCWTGPNIAVGRVEASGPVAALDGCLQIALEALPPTLRRHTVLPVGIARLTRLGPVPAGELWARAEVTTIGDDVVRCDLIVADPDGSVVVEAIGVELRSVGAATDAAELVHQVRWVPAPSAADPEPAAGTWLLVGDLDELERRLVAAGATCVRVTPGDEQQLGAVLDAWGPVCRGVVYTGRDPADAVALVRGLGRHHDQQAAFMPRLWLVTTGAQPVEPLPAGGADPDQAILWGLGRVVAAERPELRSTLVDLHPGTGGGADLYEELTGGFDDRQVVRRGRDRYVPCLETVALSAGGPRRRLAPSSTFRLVAAAPGSLESVALRVATRRAPGPDEVEIRVSASGLNFIDVLKAMDLYPGVSPTADVALGAECAGTVVAVGADVTDLAVGDDVVAITPDYGRTALLASHVTVPAAFALRRPDAMTAETAAALPVAYVTAYYALHELARVRPGERVLIHSATGGTGLAALHLCRWLGAEVLATAGTDAKRDHLRSLGVDTVLDSRRDTFAAELLDHTGGGGVDVVLNSLAGNAIDAGLHALAPGGRFVEIGKRDVYAHRHVDLASFKDNRALFVVDIAALTAQQPDYVAGIFRRVMELVAGGDLPLLPVTNSPIESAADAFRTMAHGHHVGKLVLTTPVEPPLVSVGPFRGDGTYVITGGLGALGLAVAERLARREAGTLVLLGRSGPSEGAAEAIDGLRRLGADVRVVLADVTDRAALTAALDNVRASAPPVRGVVHAAGVLADATLDQMDRAQLEAALAPKVTGGGNVHGATLDDPLDFFVLFASVAGVLGLAGQANYAAANAYLDSLAHHRRALGRPALSIDWGPWADVGLASARADRGDRLAARGLGGLGTDEALDVLETLLGGDQAQVCVMHLDRARWIEADPAAAALLGPPDQRAVAPAPTGNLRDQFSSIPAGPTRRRAVEDAVCAELAPVLRLAADRIERDRPFKALGLDSLMALELRNRLETRTGMTLPATIAWNHPTVAQLAAELTRGLLPVTGEEPEPESAAAIPLDADRVDTETEGATTQELQALLDEELAAVERLLGAEGRSS